VHWLAPMPLHLRKKRIPTVFDRILSSRVMRSPSRCGDTWPICWHVPSARKCVNNHIICSGIARPEPRLKTSLRCQTYRPTASFDRWKKIKASYPMSWPRSYPCWPLPCGRTDSAAECCLGLRRPEPQHSAATN